MTLMALRPPSALLFLLGMLGLTASRDAEVTCLVLEDCVLPCRFLQGGMVIHWYKQQVPVHSYYYSKDQLRLQNKHFSGRTHLFNTHIASGNASLMLRRVKVQDQGRYKCYTSTGKASQETFVSLRVKALIPLVRMEMTNDSVTCVSQGIYPAPEVSWRTDPPVAAHTLANFTRKTPDSKGLFSVESRVGIVGNLSDHTYFCSVISADGSQVWTASHRQQGDLLGESGRSLLIPCVAPKLLQNFTLSWSFSPGRNPSILLTYDSRTRRTSSPWEGRMELDEEQVLLGNASLRLLSPESGEDTGSYTCTFSALHTRYVLHTWVNITDPRADEDLRVCQRSWWGTAASVCVFVLTMAAGVLRCFRIRGGPPGPANGGTPRRTSLSRIDVPILDLPGPDGSGPSDGSAVRLRPAGAEARVSPGPSGPGWDALQRHPIPEGGAAAQSEPSGSEHAAESFRGSDVTIPPPLGIDWPAPHTLECDTGTPHPPGNESATPGSVECDSAISHPAGGGESVPEVTGNDVMTPYTTGNDVAHAGGTPAHRLVMHCGAESDPEDQAQGRGSSRTDSYVLRVALLPSRKDLSSSGGPSMRERDENVFIVPEQFQMNGLR